MWRSFLDQDTDPAFTSLDDGEQQEGEMMYDNEAVVRHAYHTAEGDVLDVAGFIASFTEDGVFNNVVTKESYRGAHLGDVVLGMAKLLPDVHRDLHRVTVLGDTVAVELSIQGTFLGPLETPAGIVQPTGAKIDIPCGDFWYLRDGRIETFNCYAMFGVMYAQMGVQLDFASAVAGPAAAQ
jgi:ketosteroid isomerase-like protein